MHSSLQPANVFIKKVTYIIGSSRVLLLRSRWIILGSLTWRDGTWTEISFRVELGEFSSQWSQLSCRSAASRSRSVRRRLSRTGLNFRGGGQAFGGVLVV